MITSLTHAFAGRGESLAFLTLSGNDLDCLNRKPIEVLASRCIVEAKPTVPTQEDKAHRAICDLVEELALSSSADEFIARRERLFSRYMDLMLGLGRITYALTGRGDLIEQIKKHLNAIDDFFLRADKKYCSDHLRDQAKFSVWELGKVVDLFDFIQSRPPVPQAKQKEDLNLAHTCTVELLYGRLHLDCLGTAIALNHLLSEEIQSVLSDGMRHFVNGHVAIRLGAKLRQEISEEDFPEFSPMEEDDRTNLSHYAFAGQDEEEY